MAQRNSSSGLFFALLLGWVVMEFARPSNPLKIPLIASWGCLLGWLALPRKRWNPQLVCMLLLFAETVVHVPFAENNYSAFQAAKGFFITLVTICIPLAHFVDSLDRLSTFAKTLVAVLFYMGAYAITHGGVGPAGPWGAQDENYVAMYMGVGLPFAYFGLFHSRSSLIRLAYAVCIAIFVGAVVVSLSRGGFVGLCVVALYCWLRSPRKWIGVILAALMAVVISFFASDKYWNEMSTITDTHESTADARLDAWTIAWREYLDNPVLGVGGGNFPWRMGEYEGSDMLAKYGRNMTANMVTHSLYFELLAELGSVGAILTLVILFCTFRDLRWVEKQAIARRAALGKRRSAQGDALTQAIWLSQSITGALLAFLVCSAFISTYYSSTLWLLAAVTVALRAAAEGVLHAAPRATRAAARPPVVEGAGLASLPAKAEGGPRLADLL